jgi:DNA-cytosine methyltransferase
VKQIATVAGSLRLPPNPPEQLLGDFTQCLKGLPTSSLFVCGFPCQPHSGLNHSSQKGLQSEKGQVWYAVRQYLEEAQPRTFVLENVAMLMSTPAWENILKSLEAICDPQTGSPAYIVEWNVLNPAAFGFCQSRKRVFIVGRHRRKLDKNAESPLPWPGPGENTVSEMLSTALLPNSEVRRLEPACFRPLSECAKLKVDTLQQRLSARGTTWSSRRPYLVHPHVSAARLRLNKPNRSLCLSTKCQEFFLLGPGRYLSSIECLHLMGFVPDQDFDSEALSQTTRTQRYRQAGNSMHVGLLQLLLSALLNASGDLTGCNAIPNCHGPPEHPPAPSGTNKSVLCGPHHSVPKSARWKFNLVESFDL